MKIPYQLDRGIDSRSRYRQCAASYTNVASHEQDGPVVIAAGDGIYVVDNEGNRYIEALSEPRLVDAALRQMKTLPFFQSFDGKTHQPAVELAERLIALAPVPMSKVFFANSGSEANQPALLAAILIEPRP
ncbi:adenosylmethionine-8-amino-7-oxononanoate aminotransferase [Bradyrhizobium sp. CIR48]|nr:adenosylmethionine-8-amino-7-oxononanoate aminotransferase [Bradyrhizobium sp. CIR48]